MAATKWTGVSLLKITGIVLISMSSFIIQREGLLEALRLRIKRPETDTDHSVPSTAEHKNAHGSTSPSI